MCREYLGYVKKCRFFRKGLCSRSQLIGSHSASKSIPRQYNVMFTSLRLNSPVFWDVALRRWMNASRSFERKYCSVFKGTRWLPKSLTVLLWELKISTNIKPCAKFYEKTISLMMRGFLVPVPNCQTGVSLLFNFPRLDIQNIYV